MDEPQTPRSREVVGLFETEADLQDAIDELLSSGFDRADLCLLASEETVERELGHRYRAAELEDKGEVPRVCYVAAEDLGDAEGGVIGALVYVGAVAATGAVVASGGTLATAIVAAALTGGAGGLIGTALARLIGHRHARLVQDQIDQGGLLLWVRAHDPDRERRAVSILEKHSGADVHVHGVPDRV